MSYLVKEKPGIKFKWSHQMLVHRIAVRIANKILGIIPLKMKYWIVIRRKKNEVPYSIVSGKTVVQVGAPFDTLNAGRSRGMCFCLAVGELGQVVIVEPLKQSCEAFEDAVSRFGLKNVIVHNSGAWSESGESTIKVDLKHPATNYTTNTVNYSEERETQFEDVPVDLHTIDQVAERYELDTVDILSITTNWAEREILAGARKLLENGTKYVCLAYGKDGEDYHDLMASYGYKLLSHDDRGVTYEKASLS